MTDYSYAATGAEMKKIDSFTIEHIGIPGAVLMERAALFIAEAVMQDYDGKGGIVAVCGTGNNGGDGVCAARILHCKGYPASVYLIEPDSSKYSKDLVSQLEIAKKVGVKLENSLPDRAGLYVIDAVFGTGLTREVTGVYRDVIDKINSLKSARVYSADIPSGIGSATGEVLGTAVKAHRTLTFGLVKLGMILYPGREYSGEITVCDIGFPKNAIDEVRPVVRYLKSPKLPPRVKGSNKGTYGKVLLIAGHDVAAGAAILAAKAAYRAGAGIVRVLTARSAAQAVLEAVPEAVLGTYEDDGGVLKTAIAESIKNSDVVAFGMGIGTDERATELFETVMELTDKPLVIDADALNILARKGLSDYHFKTEVVLTPHLKELSRLLSRDVAEIRRDLAATASEFAGREGFTLVCKDAATMVACPEGLFVNTSGNDGMSTGGSGDVLAGVIASFAAQGMELSQAAVNAVFLHGVAGDIAAGRLGHHAMLAGDIAGAMAEAVTMAEKRERI